MVSLSRQPIRVVLHSSSADGSSPRWRWASGPSVMLAGPTSRWADIDTTLGILCCSCKIDVDYYDNGSCDCRWRNRVCIVDGQNYLSYNYADGWVESYGTYDNSSRGPLTAIHGEMVAAHEIEWEERFGEGSRVCLSTSAVMVHPPLDGISGRAGRAACKPSEQNKLKVVKATLLEPVFGSKERSWGFR